MQRQQYPVAATVWAVRARRRRAGAERRGAEGDRQQPAVPAVRHLGDFQPLPAPVVAIAQALTQKITS
jgi:hypothetical protein